MVMWLNTLVALALNVRVRRLSRNRKERFRLAFTEVRNSPGMVERPALPNWPDTGVVNASELKYESPGAWMGRPVASARKLPPPARPPVFARLPDTFAVSGGPGVGLKLPLMFKTLCR